MSLKMLLSLLASDLNSFVDNATILDVIHTHNTNFLPHSVVSSENLDDRAEISVRVRFESEHGQIPKH